MSENNFGTTEMANALSDVAASEVAKPRPEQNFKGAPEDDKEAEDKALEYKWPKKQVYDYPAYLPNKDAPINPDEATTWASSAAKYEWNDEYGDVAPRVPELEAMLFNLEFLHREGDFMQNLKMEVKTEGPVQMAPVMKFSDAGLHPVLMETLKMMHYFYPTPIQAYCIPAVLSGKDVVANAQTGSGKTGAYMIPVISRLMGKAKKLCAKRASALTFNPKVDAVRAEPLVLIVAPTRELVCQIFDEARRLCYRTMLRPCVAYGGGPMGLQRQELQKGCDILIATPGRLVDFMSKPSILSLNRVKYTIIDEADELLHGDWEENLKAIMTGGDSNEDPDHVYMMFSATFPKEYRKIARQYMEEDYFRIRVGRIGSTHANIKQSIMWVEEPKKRDALYDLLFSMKPARTMIFVNAKRQADLIDDFLFNKGLPSTSIHADRTQREREDALLAFKHGTCPILVTTGIAARGIDIKNVFHVINFDLPSGDHGGIQEYVHRIGRTARIGHEGVATTFYNDRNEELAEGLVKLLMENDQQIPDFLEEYKPIDGVLTFDDDSGPDDDDDDQDTSGGADAWGGVPVGPTGAEAGVVADDGFKADDNSFVPTAADDNW